MARPLTIFTGQWADMKLEDLAPLAKKWATKAWKSRLPRTISI